MAWIWFALFVIAVGYIVVLKRGGAIDDTKAQASLEQSMHDFGKAVDDGVDKLRGKDKQQ